MFSSTKSLCPILMFELFTNSFLDVAWTQDSIQILIANSISSTSLLIDQSSGFKMSFYLKGSSHSAHNFVQVTAVVCGNEEVFKMSDESISIVS